MSWGIQFTASDTKAAVEELKRNFVNSLNSSHLVQVGEAIEAVVNTMPPNRAISIRGDGHVSDNYGNFNLKIETTTIIQPIPKEKATTPEL